MTQTVHYIPKGSMCAVCKHKSDNCGRLEFKKMPLLGNFALGKVVKCTEFERCKKK